TSIAVVRTDTEIVIATDSRSTDADLKPLEDVCKIRKAGALYFTVVGQATWKGADISTMIKRVLLGGGTLDNRVSSLITEVTPSPRIVLASDPPARRIANEQGSITSL